tara:strand:- start:1455 stop:1850 length:396 start_codon:yes stop_codon:yes gene_type:complete
MRHRKKGKKLGVKPAHRKSLLMNLASNLIKHGKIKTTDSRAKALRMYIEPLVTKAKKGDFNSIRQILKSLKSKDIVHKLVHEISPNFINRNGGYTRIIKLGYRENDRASVSYIEFVESNSSVQSEAGKDKE